MEAVASMSGCGLRFHPSDESLVINFLLPRNLSSEVTGSSPIIESDPYSMEPWNLLAAHGKDVEEGAYFWVKKVMLSSRGLRRKRTVGDANKILGTWRIQNCKTNWAPADMTADMTVKWGWTKTLLSYCSAKDNSRTTGYVMHEYKLLENGASEGSEMTCKYVICHVKLSNREISRRKRRTRESAASATSSSSTGGLSTSSLASASPASAASLGSDWINSAGFYPASAASPASLVGPTTLPAPNPHYVPSPVPSPALPSSPWPGILPQPAAHEVPLVPASNVDEAALAPIPHEFSSDCFSSDFFFFSSFDTFDDNDSNFFI